MQDKIQELESKIDELKRELEEMKGGVKDWENFQLKRPLDSPTTILIEDVVKDIRNYKRIRTITSSATPQPDAETDDMFVISALAAAATFSAPRGNPTNGQMLLIRIEDNGTARALSWNAIYRAGAAVALPTTTTLGKMIYIGFMYNATDSKWDILGFQDGY